MLLFWSAHSLYFCNPQFVKFANTLNIIQLGVFRYFIPEIGQTEWINRWIKVNKQPIMPAKKNHHIAEASPLQLYFAKCIHGTNLSIIKIQH